MLLRSLREQFWARQLKASLVINITVTCLFICWLLCTQIQHPKFSGSLSRGRWQFLPPRSVVQKQEGCKPPEEAPGGSLVAPWTPCIPQVKLRKDTVAAPLGLSEEEPHTYRRPHLTSFLGSKCVSEPSFSRIHYFVVSRRVIIFSHTFCLQVKIPSTKICKPKALFPVD